MMKSGRRSGSDLFQRFLAVGQSLDLEPIDFEQRSEIFPNARFVIHHHNFLLLGHGIIPSEIIASRFIPSDYG